MYKLIRVFVLLWLLFFDIGCTEPPETTQIAETELPILAGKSILMIISHTDFRDEEYREPRSIFEMHGAKVTVACSSTDTAVGMLGLRVKPDILIEDTVPEDYNAIVLVGGVGSTEYWNDEHVHNLVRTAVDSNKVVAAICLAPVTLAKSGVLNGVKATVYESAADELKSVNSVYTGNDVEVSDKIITANGPKSAKKFAVAIVNALKNN